jgi:peptide deformylase
MKKKAKVIRTFPDIILKVKTKTIQRITVSVKKILEEMINISHKTEAAGLAANQIGISRNLAVAVLENGEFMKLINPRIIEASGEQIEEEGCLSIPNVVLEIPRAKIVTVEYLDPEGNRQEFTASGFTARVLQHEIDHLNGLLIIDRLPKEKKLKFLREYK